MVAIGERELLLEPHKVKVRCACGSHVGDRMLFSGSCGCDGGIGERSSL